MIELTTDQKAQLKSKVEPINGFSHRPDILQVTSYLVYLYFLLSHMFVALPACHYLHVQIITTTAFAYSSVVLAFKVMQTTLSEPTDLVVKLTKLYKIEKKTTNFEHLGYFCKLCDSWVQENTKHCRVCQRCVSGFDHHCPWINNCVGN